MKQGKFIYIQFNLCCYEAETVHPTLSLIDLHELHTLKVLNIVLFIIITEELEDSEPPGKWKVPAQKVDIVISALKVCRTGIAIDRMKNDEVIGPNAVARNRVQCVNFTLIRP